MHGFGRSGYTAGVAEPISSLNAPEHIAGLRASPSDDFETIPELDRWARGIPADQLPEARALWQSWLGDPTRAAAVFRLSVQLAGELDLAERYTLFADAARLTEDEGYRTALAANAASTAVRLEDLDGARRWLDECHPAPKLLSADSAHRIAAATLAISEGSPADAVQLLGERDGALPILRSYRPLAMAVRAHALRASGNRSAADRALGELFRRVGVDGGRSIIDKLPRAWNIDASYLDVHWRGTEARSAWLRLAGGSLVAGAAIAIGAAANADLAGAGVDRDAWFKLLAVSPFLLGLSAWLILTGRRNLRIAKHGFAGAGRVVGKSRRAYRSQRSVYYGLSVQADLLDPDGRVWPVLATSIDDYGSSRANELLDSAVRILWHPRHPGVAIVKLERR